MAKPIRPTPTLRGEDARRFIAQMLKEEKTPDRKRLAIIRRALKADFDIIN